MLDPVAIGRSGGDDGRGQEGGSGRGKAGQWHLIVGEPRVRCSGAGWLFVWSVELELGQCRGGFVGSRDSVVDGDGTGET